MIFDHSGREVGRSQREHQQILPRAGWVEHDPGEIWRCTTEVVGGALEAAGLTAADLVGLGLTNQRETTVVWDVRTGEPYANAIVWQDTRTDKIAAELERDGHGELIRERAGIPPSTYFAGGKLAWLLRNVDGVREAAEAGHALFGTIDSWLLWQLTGGPDGGRHLTDVTNASRTMLMDLTTLDWDDELLELFGGPPVPAARDRAVQPRRGVRHHPVGRALRRGAVDRRGAGRPARGHGRPGLPGDRRGQEHLRHRQLPAAEHRHRDLPVGERAADHRVLPVRRRARDVRAGGLDRGHRLGGAVAARPARDHPRRQRDRGPGRRGGRRGRGLLRAGLLRAVRPVLAPRRPRRDRRPVPLPHPGPPGPGGPGGDLLPERGRGAGDGGRLGRRAGRAQGRRRGDRERPVHADPGRHARRRRQPAGGGGDHGARARRTRPGWPAGSGARRTSCGTTGTRTGAGPRRPPPSSGPTGHAGWQKAVQRTLDWVDV